MHEGVRHRERDDKMKQQTLDRDFQNKSIKMQPLSMSPSPTLD